MSVYIAVFVCILSVHSICIRYLVRAYNSFFHFVHLTHNKAPIAQFRFHRTVLCNFNLIALSCASHHLVHSLGLGDLKSSEGAIPLVFVVPERLQWSKNGLGDLKSSKGAIPLVFVMPERHQMVWYSHLPVIAMSS
ncbi:unnamed protein product [Camellia sinensis]